MFQEVGGNHPLLLVRTPFYDVLQQHDIAKGIRDQGDPRVKMYLFCFGKDCLMQFRAAYL